MKFEEDVEINCKEELSFWNIFVKISKWFFFSKIIELDWVNASVQ